MFDLLGIGVGEVLVEDTGYAGADDLADDGIGSTHLAFVFQFDLAGDAGEGGDNVGVRGGRRGFRLWRNARRSAFEMTSSMVEMGRR